MGIVYSSEHGRMCPECGRKIDECVCKQKNSPIGDGIVRIKKETAKRNGKTVTTVFGILLEESELKILVQKLKKQCQSGGTIKDGVIEIQGDFTRKIKEILEKNNFRVKLL